jgi:hypothetical protein
MSLNHATPDDEDFAFELSDQKNARDNIESNRHFFRKGYRKKSPYFQARAPVLHAYAAQIRAAGVPAAEDWRGLNSRFALYLEAFPTRSRKFETPRLKPSRGDLEREVFVCALNSIVHDVVMRLLQPRRILLAGKKSWDAWPDPGLSSYGQDVGSRVRSTGKHICPVHRNDAPSEVYGTMVRVVRTNFLRIVCGPNSNNELLRLGRDVLA